MPAFEHSSFETNAHGNRSRCLQKIASGRLHVEHHTYRQVPPSFRSSAYTPSQTITRCPWRVSLDCPPSQTRILNRSKRPRARFDACIQTLRECYPRSAYHCAQEPLWHEHLGIWCFFWSCNTPLQYHRPYTHGIHENQGSCQMLARIITFVTAIRRTKSLVQSWRS